MPGERSPMIVVQHKDSTRALLFIFFWLALATDDSVNAQPPEQPAADALWTIAYSPSMPHALSLQGRKYYFDFPTSADGIHYVTRPAPVVRLGETIKMVFSLEGRGKLVPSEGNPPARIRIFIQRRGDRLSAKEPYKRWWSLAHVQLVSPGTFTLSAKIEPRHWSSVFGKIGSEQPREFADCVANLEHVGFTFGGDFAGHGVYVVNGAVRLVLEEYSVGLNRSIAQ